MADFTTKQLQVNGLDFNVLDEGDGAPVLLLHGFPDSWRLWRHQVPALLDAGFRVIAPDQRGFGESAKPQEVEAYSADKLLGDLLGILDQLGVPKTHVVGHDWGGAMAWTIAGLVPDRVDRLVAMSVPHPQTLFSSVRQYALSWYMLMFQYPFAEEVLMRDDWKLMREWGGNAKDIDVYIKDLSRPGALTAGLNWYRAGARPEALFRVGDAFVFPSVKADTLGIWSSGDAYLLEDGFLETEKHIEGSWRYERIDEASHWMQLDQPQAVNRLLVDFLT
ncbi:MAG: alpha/beta hydrolase [Dehalococcoidia bacterium]